MQRRTVARCGLRSCRVACPVNLRQTCGAVESRGGRIRSRHPCRYPYRCWCPARVPGTVYMYEKQPDGFQLPHTYEVRVRSVPAGTGTGYQSTWVLYTRKVNSRSHRLTSVLLVSLVVSFYAPIPYFWLTYVVFLFVYISKLDRGRIFKWLAHQCHFVYRFPRCMCARRPTLACTGKSSQGQGATEAHHCCTHMRFAWEHSRAQGCSD